MEPTIDQLKAAIIGLENTLQQERSALFRLRQDLLQRSIELALEHAGDYAEIAGLTQEIHAAINFSEQAIAELPEIIEELQEQLEEAQRDARSKTIQNDQQRNDQLFFAALEQITTAGTATPADLLHLRKLAADSSNRARKYDIDRLTEALEDHDRRVKAAKGHNQETPVFAFVLEEKGGQ